MIGELVEKYHKIKAKIDTLEAEHKAKLAPYAEAEAKVKGAIMQAMDEMGVVNVKTEFGTPYFSHPETYRITDVKEFLGWVEEQGAYGVLPETITRKTELREFMFDGATPPGVEVSTIRRLNIPKGK
jgi:hypothetical protein